jgi:Family of unknown function (DUF6401)
LVVTFGDCLSIVVPVSTELSEITLRLAGEVGASGLSRSAGFPGLLAVVDQHAAQVRDALTGPSSGDRPRPHSLLGYARGFVEVAIGRGWLPDVTGTDWETLRLAAVCQLMTQAR